MLTDSTLIYRGSYNRIKPSIWELGQFERNVLECSLLLLSTVGRIAPAFRGDPVRVSRALSAICNSPDDDGAIMGNWSEDFSGTTAHLDLQWLLLIAFVCCFFFDQVERHQRNGSAQWKFYNSITGNENQLNTVNVGCLLEH